MERFLGHWGPKVCEILHLPQLKQNNNYFFGKKKENPKERQDERVPNAIITLFLQE